MTKGHSNEELDLNPLQREYKELMDKIAVTIGVPKEKVYTLKNLLNWSPEQLASAIERAKSDLFCYAADPEKFKKP